MRDALLRLHVVRLYLSNTFALHIPKTIEPREHVEISGVQKNLTKKTLLSLTLVRLCKET